MVIRPLDLSLRSFAHAVGVLAYVAGVAWTMFNASAFLDDDQSGFLTPVFVLLLFIVSALVTGLLVLGKPIQLYLDGLRADAVTLLLAILGWLVAFLAAVLGVMILT
jgi:hypothetical protein